jgi:hypothetical protein
MKSLMHFQSIHVNCVMSMHNIFRDMFPTADLKYCQLYLVQAMLNVSDVVPNTRTGQKSKC